MASRNILQLVSSACYRSNIPAPASLVSSTDRSAQQLLHLLYGVAEDLRAEKWWTQRKRTFSIYLQDSQRTYALPADFYCSLPFTYYDRANSWGMLGPMADGDWNFRIYGTDFQGTTKAYRLFGVGDSNFQIDPIPGAGDQDVIISFDYITRNLFLPPAWVAQETIAQDIWRHASGRLYKKTNSSTHTTGTSPPVMQFGEGLDGSVVWKALAVPVFTANFGYPAGQYYTNGGNLYRVTVGGASDLSSGPTGTTPGVDIVNGTNIVRYIPAAAWMEFVDYEYDDHILISGRYYRAVRGGQTGVVTPNWTTTLDTDGTVEWTFQDTAYEEPLTDSDLCLFDDDVVIMGIRALYAGAHGMDNSDLMLSYEKLKRRGIGRWNQGLRLDMANHAYSPGPFASAPEGSWEF